MFRTSGLLILLSLALVSGCGGGTASTELTPDLVEAAKVHDEKVANDEAAHQKAQKEAQKAEAAAAKK